MTHNNTDTIRLGLLAPLSGIVSIYGQDIARAGQIATSLVNDKGGLLGRKLELVIADDGSLPETDVSGASLE